MESYQRNIDVFVRSFNKFYGSDNNYTIRMNQLFSMLNTSSYSLNYLYLRHYSIDNENLNCLVYSRSNYNISSQVSTNWSPDGPNSNYNMVPTTGYNITFSYNLNINYNTLNNGVLSSVSVTDFIPSVLMYRMPSEIVDCMQQAGYGYQGPIVDIKQQIADMKETLNDISNTINEEPSDDKANTDLQNMIPDTTTDITTSGFNSIFEKIKDGILNPVNKSIYIDIPFTNGFFVINTMSLYGGRYFAIRDSVLGQLIQSFYWFGLSYYIYKDIANIINKVKSGNIESIENSNIKEGML